MLENSAQIVDALRIRLGVDTDSAVASALGVHHSAVGHWRQGRSAMGPELAMKAAELLGVEAGPLVLVCLAETERREPIAALFRQLAARVIGRRGRPRKVAAVLAVVAVGAGLGGAPGPSQAAAGPSAGPAIHYANWRRRRTWRPRRRFYSVIQATA